MKDKFRVQHILSFNLMALLIIMTIFAIAAQWFSNIHKDQLISQNIELSNQRIKTIIDLQSRHKSSIVNDYTFWDDMVLFISSRDETWAKENILTMLKNYDMDFALVYDQNGNISSYHTLKDTLNVANIISKAQCTEMIYQMGNFHWFTHHNNEYYELFGATVHPSDDPKHTTSPHGFFAAGNIIDHQYIDKLAQFTNTSIHLAPTGTFKKSDLPKKEVLFATLALKDKNDNPIVDLVLTKQPEFLNLFNLWSKTYLAILIICVAFILLIYYFALAKWVSKPLNLIGLILDQKESLTRIKDLRQYGQEFSLIGDLIQKHAIQQRQMAQLKTKAEEADHLKSMFLANMSHEIRTPINGLVGFSELISQSNDNKELLDEYKKMIKSCAHDLMHIMDDIIEISKIDAGIIQLKPHDFSLLQLLSELDAYFSHQIKQKGKQIRLIIKKPDTEMPLHGDGYRLKQMLNILLDNAVKFTEQGHIELTYRIDKGKLSFKVKDTGIGIKREKRKVIFERFRQCDEQMARIHSGNGLGLAIFKKLADMMHADITLESESNKGTTFYLKIPFEINRTKELNSQAAVVLQHAANRA
jgi:signal transduction histidine kinase